MLKKLYHVAAFVALLHVTAVVLAGGFLIFGGSLDATKINAALAGLRGEVPDGMNLLDEPETGDGPIQQAVQKEQWNPGDMDHEILQRETERAKEELRQRLALNNRILLRVTTEREAFDRQKEDEARDRVAGDTQRQERGFRKQVGLLEGMPPADAVDFLLTLDDPDMAARIIFEMDDRKARKMMSGAAGADQRAKMMEILRRVREAAPEKAGAGGS